MKRAGGVVAALFLGWASIGTVGADTIPRWWEYKDFSWKSPDPTVFFKYWKYDPASSTYKSVDLTAHNSVCFLTKIWGGFYGNLQEVYLSTNPDRQSIHQDPVNDIWFLHGMFPPGEGGATARCVLLDAFSAYRKNPSGLMWGKTGAEAVGWSSSWRWLWWADAISALHGVRGEFSGFGEQAGVRPQSDSNPNNPTHVAFAVFAQSQLPSNQYVDAWGRSIYLGSPIRYTGRYSLNTSSAASVPMGYADEQFCYLAAMRGKFRGGAEWIRVGLVWEASTSRYRWSLDAHTQQTSIGADAECIAY